MPEHTIHLTVPDDVFTPGRTYGSARAEIALRTPDDMTPDRFREIAAQKGARLGVACYALGPKYGPVLMATWEESGCKVVMSGTVDQAEGSRDLAARKGVPYFA